MAKEFRGLPQQNNKKIQRPPTDSVGDSLKESKQPFGGDSAGQAGVGTRQADTVVVGPSHQAAMIGGLMVINKHGQVVIHRAYRDDVSQSAAEAFRAQVVGRKEAGSQAPVRFLDGASFLYTRRNDVYLAALTRANVNAALVFEFLFQLDRILVAYLGEGYSETEVRNNFTLVYELLDEVLDAGYPQTCEVDALKLLVNLGAAHGAGAGPASASSLKKTAQITAQITGAIDWRGPNVRHKVNEVFIDVNEEVGVLVSSDGTVLSSHVNGVVVLKAFLSGTPECSIGLNDKLSLKNSDSSSQSSSSGSSSSSSSQSPSSSSATRAKSASRPGNVGAVTGAAADVDVDLADCTFHRCVRLGKFEQERAITFVPPDGEFELMRYRVTRNVHLPFKVIPVVEEVSRSRVVINLRLLAQFSEKEFANNVVVRIPCPGNTARIRPVVNKGKARYDPAQSAIVWRIRKMPGKSEVNLTCAVDTLATTKQKPWSRPPIQLDFVVPLYASSGLIVRYLKVVEKSGYDSKQWVKYKTRASSGKYQIRI